MEGVDLLGLFITGYNFHPETGNKGPEGVQSYSSIPSLTSSIDGGRWSTQRHGGLNPEKENPYLFCRWLRGPQVWSEWLWKISALREFDPQTVQPVASSYTD